MVSLPYQASIASSVRMPAARCRARACREPVASAAVTLTQAGLTSVELDPDETRIVALRTNARASSWVVTTFATCAVNGLLPSIRVDALTPASRGRRQRLRRASVGESSLPGSRADVMPSEATSGLRNRHPHASANPTGPERAQGPCRRSPGRRRALHTGRGADGGDNALSTMTVSSSANRAPSMKARTWVKATGPVGVLGSNTQTPGCARRALVLRLGQRFQRPS